MHSVRAGWMPRARGGVEYKDVGGNFSGRWDRPMYIYFYADYVRDYIARGTVQAAWMHRVHVNYTSIC